MKKQLLFVPAIGAFSLILFFASSCSSTIKYRVEFIGDHLHFRGEGDYIVGSNVIGNIYADDGYSIPANINVAGVKDFTYDNNKGDVSFVINHNVIITANACYSFKFFGNNCIATGEGFDGANEFEYRFDYLRSNPLEFSLASTDLEHTLPKDVDITFNDKKGKNGEDYIYDTLSKTLKVLNLSEKIEACASSDLTYPLLCNFTHCDVTGLKKRFREGERVNFTIDADPGYDLPETVNVDGTTQFLYQRDADKEHANFVLINGMPNKRVILRCDSAIRSYSVGIQGGEGHYSFKTPQTTVKHGEWFLNYLKTDDEGYVLPENISVLVNGRPIANFYYYSQTGAIYIDENIIDGPVIIETDLTSKKFPFNFISSIAYAEGMQDEYPYGPQEDSSTFTVKLNNEYTYPILSYEVKGLSNSDYTFDCDTGIFNLLKMPALPVELKILSATPNSFAFTHSLTNCHFETSPKEKYAYGEMINLKIVGNNSYDTPSSVNVTGVQSSDFHYDSETGDFVITRMPAKNVSISATSTNEIIRIDDSYVIVTDKTEHTNISYATQINEAIKYYLGYELDIVNQDSTPTDNEIIVNSNRTEATSLLSEISDKDNGYAISASNNKIIVVGKTGISKMCAIDRLLSTYINKGGFRLPCSLRSEHIIGECAKDDTNIKEFSIKYNPPLDPNTELRDPFIFEKPLDSGGYDYYLYGTLPGAKWWQVFKCEGKISEETDKWVPLGECTDKPDYITHNRWAPEVYEYTYNGETNYYMFTTYRNGNEEKERRGVTVMKSSSLEPQIDKFKVISYDPDEHLGFITPHTYDWKIYIDGTLYVDEENNPWIIYVDNFNSAPKPDREGGMLTAKLTKDLTRMVSIPVENFKAREASWVGQYKEGNGYVTDGPFIYRCKSGKLIMQWSSYAQSKDTSAVENEYALGYATSSNGSVIGKWEQHDRLLFEKNLYNEYTGGHGHFFFDHTINQLYLCCHTPNSQDDTEVEEHPILIPIKESYDTLVWDIYQR